MSNEELIKYMGDYAIKMMGRKIGYKKATDWINNYKFPTSNRDLIKLTNIWHGIICNILMDLEDEHKL